MALSLYRNARATPDDTPPEAPKDRLGAVPAAELPGVDESLENLEGRQSGAVQVVMDDKTTGEVVVQPQPPTPCGA